MPDRTVGVVEHADATDHGLLPEQLDGRADGQGQVWLKRKSTGRSMDSSLAFLVAWWNG
jgi:hypothetical protein